MFSFHWPWMALLLLAPLLLRLLWLRTDGRSPEQDAQLETLLHPALEHLQESFTARHPQASLASRIQTLLLALLWVSLTLSLMRPQWLEPHTETRSEGYDLMLVVDTSRSMEALDFTVNNQRVTRMAVLKGVMDRFIANRSGDRLGLIIFGSSTYMISPLTYDLEAVRAQLTEVNPGIAGSGTAMGDAIGLGVHKLRDRPEGSRVMILVADGGNTEGSIPPAVAAQLAAMSGIRVYVIGVGSTEKKVPMMENGRLVMRDDLTLDENILQRIAITSDGAYFRATDTNALEDIYQRIDKLEKTHAEARTILIPTPLYQWPLGVALILLLLLGMYPEGRARTWQRATDA